MPARGRDQSARSGQPARSKGAGRRVGEQPRRRHDHWQRPERRDVLAGRVSVTNAGTINNGSNARRPSTAGANGIPTNSAANAIIQNKASAMRSTSTALTSRSTMPWHDPGHPHCRRHQQRDPSASVTNSGLIMRQLRHPRRHRGATTSTAVRVPITATAAPPRSRCSDGDNASVTNNQVGGLRSPAPDTGVFISGTNGAVTNNGSIIAYAGNGASLPTAASPMPALISAGTTGLHRPGVYAGGASPRR